MSASPHSSAALPLPAAQTPLKQPGRQQGGPHAGPYANGLWLAVHLPGQTLEAARLYQFSPRVCLHPPDMLLTEISGSLKLFGGLQALRQKVSESFTEAALTTGIAPTPIAARLLALADRDVPLTDPGKLAFQLEKLPLALLAADLPKLYPRLARLGIRQLGELLRLPRAGLRKRFGATLIDWIERLLGQRPDLRDFWQPPRHYQADLDFDDPLSGSNELLPVIDRMLAASCRWLRYHELRSTGLTLQFFHQHRPGTELGLRLLRPSGNAEQMSKLLALHMERLQLPAPSIALRLTVEGLVEKRADNLGWWHPDGDSEDWWLTLESIRARLGDDTLRLLNCVDEHRPELAWQELVCQELACQKKAGRTKAEPPVGNARPLWLLPRPRLLGARDTQDMQLLSRPERIVGGWWDSKPLQRDYFMARIGSRTLWVFRSVEGWYEHGQF